MPSSKKTTIIPIVFPKVETGQEEGTYEEVIVRQKTTVQLPLIDVTAPLQVLPQRSYRARNILFGCFFLLLLISGGVIAKNAIMFGEKTTTSAIIYASDKQMVTYLPYIVSVDGAQPTVTFQASPVPTPVVTGKPKGWSILGSPTISVNQMNQILSYYGSPAAGHGQDFYDVGKAYGIDPVYALAFFHHESDFGETGVARYTLSIGNSRCVNGNCYYTNDGGYQKYATWRQGIEEWYWQMQQYTNGNLYQYLHGYKVDLITVDQIIPVYAPPSDYNDDSAYIAAIKSAVNIWRAGKIAV